MPLAAGTRLGRYEVLGLIGAGGMGEVYCARDARLGRKVAIKVLPESVTFDARRLQRFEREARAVAALNHPNILTVYDVGTHGGAPYLVMELLEGKTLRELTRRRAPTQTQVLGFAVQVAQGLDAAHDKGIVHRDLKPANLFVTTEGRVKVLDFGIAKLVEQGSLDTEAVTASGSTGPGQVLGTAAYMSPEQARAGPVDHRSDIFSFGVVLYELLSGKHPFLRDTTVGTLTAIVEDTPAELSSLSRGVPPALSGIVQRCLEKDREQRFRSAHDLALSLEAVLAAPAGAASLQEMEERSPYPGLSSFAEKDAAFFFGREAEVPALWEKLQLRHLSVVIGPSGAGKSSFVRAGVVASRPAGWGALVCTPGALTALEEDFARSMADKARRKKRLVRLTAAVAFVAISAVAVVIGVSRQQAARARDQARVEALSAEASKLLALGQVEIERYPTAALAYTMKSLEINDTPEGRLQALRALWKAPPERVLPVPEGTSAVQLAFSGDGRWLATTCFSPPCVALFSEDGRFVRRLTEEGAEYRPTKDRPTVPRATFGGDAVFWWIWNARVLAWTLDGRSFAPFDGPQRSVMGGTDDGAYTIGLSAPGASGATLHEWSVSRGASQLVRSLPLAPGEEPDPSFSRLIRRAGPELYVRSFPRQGAPGPPVLVGRHESDIDYVTVPPGAERLLSIDRSGEWRVWSTQDRRLLVRRRPPPAHLYSEPVFDPDASRIGWASSEGSGIYVWSLDDPPDAELLKLRPGQVGVDMTVPAFDPGGRWMAVSYGYDSVSFWPIRLPYSRVLVGHTQGPITALRFTADSHHLISCARDGLRIWPLRPGEGPQERVAESWCYGADASPGGDTVALAAALDGLFVVPATTRAARRLLTPEPQTFFENTAFDPAGRRLATVEVHLADQNEHVIREVDLASGAVRSLRYRDRQGSPPVEAPTLGYTWDGRLLLGGNDGIFVWESQAERPTALLPAPGKQSTITTTPDGRWLAAVIGHPTGQTALGVGGGEALVFDLKKGTHSTAAGHGSDVQAAALDASGSLLATGDSSGTVRVGPAAGGAAHLLVGHTTGVNMVAVSSDGKWIASASGSEIRLWPMPDVSQPPLHTLPHAELMARLRALTNLEVVEDPLSATGYRVAVGPFPGWKDLPTW